MTKLCIGLMSGTSLDGLDAVLVDFSNTIPQVIESLSRPYPDELRRRILKLCTPGEDEIDQMGRLDAELGAWAAESVNQLLLQADTSYDEILAIGSHGQTIRHRPSPPFGFTLQIGDPNQIAYHTGITTIADFRRLDMAAGGQGAPLVPAFHQAIFHSAEEDRVIMNIGGIANITHIPRDGQSTIGFDTGPGNVLMDAWMQAYYQQPYDKNGNIARSGQIQQDLLETLLDDAFFETPPPKSTGREHFNMGWLGARIHKTMSARDVMATLCELTAISSSDAIKRYASGSKSCFLCGGGAQNSFLVERLKHHLEEARVSTTDELGLNSAWVEATAFAWLAYRRMNQLSGNLPPVTGAEQSVLLGSIYQARSASGT
ncbi:MAG: anhydro-N-acetylmuramic acid kinase [Gammaproteobacteria bacterium]|nr:anhydro-N-acetylmuramic acid kinase [Gammaproteobacteria bacterium]